MKFNRGHLIILVSGLCIFVFILILFNFVIVFRLDLHASLAAPGLAADRVPVVRAGSVGLPGEGVPGGLREEGNWEMNFI